MKNFRIFGICLLLLICIFGSIACSQDDKTDKKGNIECKCGYDCCYENCTCGDNCRCDDYLVPVPVGEDSKGKLLILQAFGTGPGGRAVNRSFVELYNNSALPIDLKGAYLWFADGNGTDEDGNVTEDKDKDWFAFDLEGIIPARGSFLITGKDMPDTTQTFAGLVIPDEYGDLESEYFTLSNDSFKVALFYSFTMLTDEIQNPFDIGDGTSAPGYLDMVGARNSNSDTIFGFETAPARNSRSEAVRRRNLVDTDDNRGYHPDRAPNGYGDFVSIRYAELTAEERELFRPRNSKDKRWTPFGVPTGIAITSGKASMPLGSEVILSLAPLNANTGNLTFSWNVINSNPAGVFIFDAKDQERFTVTAALEGTATVTLTASGGVLTSPLTSSINLTVIEGSSMLMILQANTHGNDNGGSGGFKRSLVELYNNTSDPINLSTGNYYLHIGNSTDPGWTNSIKLEGTVPAQSSFLILSNSATVNAQRGRAELPAADQLANFVFVNNAFKVALMRNQPTLSVVNPFGNAAFSANYIDMLGVRVNDANLETKANAFETAPAWQSRPQGPRRVTLIDTDNNFDDFKQVDFRGIWPGNRTPNDQLYKIWPRNSAMGPWNPISGFPIMHPTVLHPVTGVHEFP